MSRISRKSSNKMKKKKKKESESHCDRSDACSFTQLRHSRHSHRNLTQLWQLLPKNLQSSGTQSKGIAQRRRPSFSSSSSFAGFRRNSLNVRTVHSINVQKATAFLVHVANALCTCSAVIVDKKKKKKADAP